MQFDIETATPPAKRSPVVFYDKAGTTKTIGGIVERRTPLHQGGPECYRIEVLGFSRYYDFCYWTKQYTADTTLKAVLADLVTDKLAAYGIGLDAGQVDGPTLTAPFGWTNRKVSDVIKDLVEQTGFMEQTSAELKLRMFAPGTATYGTTITNLNASQVSWADSTQTPATRVICIFGPTATQEVTQLWTANGSDTSWVTDIPAALGTLAPGYVTVNGVINTVGTEAQFEWDAATSTLSVGTASTPSNGHVIELVYIGQFPFEIIKDSLASPAIEAVLTFPSITNYPQADEIAEEQLSQSNQDPRVLSIDTLLDGITPGMALPINVSEVDAGSTSGLVTAVRGTLNTDLFWEYSISAEETTASLQKDPISRLKQVIGQSGSGTVALSGSVVDRSVYKFARGEVAQSLGFGAAGDILEVYAVDGGGTHQTLRLDNTIVGGAGGQGPARVELVARGWENVGTPGQTTQAMIRLESTVAAGVTEATVSAASMILQNTASVLANTYGEGHTYRLRRSNGTAASPSNVADNDVLGTIEFSGLHTAAQVPAASIRAEVAGTPGANDMPGRLVFAVTPDGSATPVDRLELNNGQLALDGAALDCYGDSTSQGFYAYGNLQYLYEFGATAAQAGILVFARGRGTTGSRSIVQSGDLIGTLEYQAHDGITERPAASIRATVDGTPVSGDMPGALIVATTLSGDSSPTDRLTINNAGALRFHAYGAGTLTTDASGNVTATSDERLKDIQGDYDAGLSAILGLTPKRYTWKPETKLDTENTYAGFVAQNVLSQVPEAVGIAVDGTLSVNLVPIVAALVNAVQALTAEVDTLRQAARLPPVNRRTAPVVGNDRAIKSDTAHYRAEKAAADAAADGVSRGPRRGAL
jgi:hypothetical protein